MPDKFDPYREALVVEQTTVWGDDFDDIQIGDRAKIEQELHADPENASNLEYVRMHTGFSRQITVTDDDLTRLGFE